MREIKFQILWVKNNRDFTVSIETHYTTIDKLTNGLDKFDYLNVEILAKRQYTGLKDKNGVEVYEDDIVKWRCLDELCFDITNRPMKIDVVKYVNGHFWPVSSPTHTCYYSVDDPEFEVIGNIYENPELKD